MTEATPWHEDDDLWRRFQPFLFPPEKYEQATEQVDALVELLALEDEQRVLDCPCGVGRHAVELAGRGHDVTGVDGTDRFLDAAREHAADEGVDVEFVHDDMREFVRPDTYDLALNVFTSFGYFEDRADDRRTARNLYESLRPDGRLLMELTSKELLAAKYQERGWEERDGDYMLEERTVTDDWSWMDNRWVLVADGETHEYEVSHRLYSARELSDLLADVGFADVSVYGDWTGSEFGPDAERMVVVAQK
jgi:SAM-dependent methyltransferase